MSPVDFAPIADDAYHDPPRIRPARHFGWEAAADFGQAWRLTRRGAERWAKRKARSDQRWREHYDSPWTEIRP